MHEQTQIQDLSVSIENLSLPPRKQKFILLTIFKEIIPLRGTDSFMSIKYLGEKGKKKAKNPKETLNYEIQQNFQPNHSQNLIPNPCGPMILQKIFSCNSSFTLAET